MPWQKHWALVAGELIEDPETGLLVPAYPEAFDTLMRQQGKTLFDLSWELDRALLWDPFDGKPQSIAYTGQTGLEARKKFRKEHWPLISGSPLKKAVLKPRFMAEDTGLDFHNGAIITIWSNSPEAGHGAVADLGIMDEIWADIDDRREQAFIPATATRHDRQKLLSSTAGTDKSTLYLRKQAVGRAAVTNGLREGMAYLEFSFHPDDDPEDPRTWWANMPALGHTISERTVRNALEEMRGPDGDLSEFLRAWGNVTKRTGGDRLIPADVWATILDSAATPAGQVVIGVDAQPDQSTASIGIADPTGTCEVAVHGSGTGWLLDKTAEMAKRHKAQVAVDVAGPVGHLADQLKQRNVEVVPFSPRNVAHACAEIYARMGEQPPTRVKVRPNFCDHCSTVPITEAVEGANRQTSGDGWKWSRKSTHVDISPLMAITLALGVQAGIGGEVSGGKVLFAWGN